MPLLQPSSCSCFQLKLPKLPSSLIGTTDEAGRRKLTLDCRTGAAVAITRSNIFVHGGLTIPLNLTHVNSANIQKELILYFSKEKSSGSNFKKLDDWISSETFFLDLVSRIWKRVEVNFDDDKHGSKESDSDSSPTAKDDNESDKGKTLEEEDDIMTPKFKERLYHSICFADSCLYIFGGLVVSPQSGYELIATNELWKLDLDSKKWSLVSKDLRITRRFAHSMHTLNQGNEDDTKLVIVGGLNNMDIPLSQVDIFNITKNCWETESYSTKIITNVDNEETPVVKESSFSLLIENNEAKIPTLAIYSPKNSLDDDSSKDNANDNDNNSDNVSGNSDGKMKDGADETESTNLSSPIVAFPLMQEAQGLRMDSKLTYSSSDPLEMPCRLQFPSGDYFGYTIIISGYYPNCHSSNLRCFIYDTSTQQWTILALMCQDGDVNKHRFWKLMAWQSHHQALFLGTKHDDYNLPSVQKFDLILSFGLPMISIFSRTPHSVRNQDFRLVPCQNTSSSRTSSIAPEAIDPKESEQRPFRKPSYASTATSQFENYIRYIAPPLEMTSIRTVFPPYAMVLGKDTLEIFGNPLSDFEFITDEGDSIGVPLYLLRKRWGRYFAMVLSQGYARACAEYENSGQSSDFIRFSPHSSQVMCPTRNSEFSRGSLDTFSNRNKSNQGDLEDPKSYSLSNIHSHEPGMTSSHRSKSPSSTPPFYEDDEDPVSPPSRAQNEKDSKPNRPFRSSQKNWATSTTSSSGGMIFRVPFQENISAALSDTALATRDDHQEKRRSSSVATAALNYLKPNSYGSKWRRASHPNPIISTSDTAHNSYAASRYMSTSSRNSRRTSSLASHNSSISYVSSSSDRMGNSIFPRSRSNSRAGSPFLGVLNIALPPQEQLPNEAIPLAPQEGFPSATKNNNSLAEYLYSHSSKSSPFSSRRPSHDRRSSSYDSGRHVGQFESSLDKQIMDGSQVLDSPLDFPSSQQRSMSKPPYKSTDSGTNSFGKISMTSDINRLSLGSNAGSSDGATPNAVEWEPLLTPRTLYMPWPTATVRAFAEFFFTGQVNGKWMLAPVVLNLLIMSRIYEIPLLYNLISEVLYSIIGRKEDSLHVICNSLLDAFRSKASRFCNDDHELMEEYLSKNETYNELLKLKLSLEKVDSGFFEIDLIKKVSRAFSASTNSDSGPDKSTTSGSRGASLGALSTIPTVFAGGPRDSHNSIGSIGYPTTFRQTSSGGPRQTINKSSLSKEIGPKIREDKNSEFPDLLESSKSVAADTIQDRAYNQSFMHDTASIYSSGSSSSSEQSGDNYEDAVHDIDSDGDEEFETKIIDARTDGERDFSEEESEEEYGKNIDELYILSQRTKSEAESGSSMSDSDGLNSDIGLLSLNKMKRKIAGQDDLDESIDPLSKIGINNESVGKDTPSQTRANNSKLARDGTSLYELSTPTLENLASPNALPPVDYVIKSIYRTAALVNYPRLMVRCLDCIEMSKRLRALKKKALSSLSDIEEDLNRPGSLSQEFFKRRMLEKRKSDSALSRNLISRPASLTKISDPVVGTISRSSSQQRMSPVLSNSRESDNSRTSKMTGVPQRRSIKNKFFGDSPTPPTTTAVFMSSAFMPPPSPYNKSKRAGPSQNSGAFSFFSKKK